MPNNEENKNYEVSFLVKSDSEKEELVKILKDSQFSVIKDGQISRIKLNFPVKKENFAYFGYLYFSGEPANIQKLSDKLKNESKILRFLIISRPVINESENKISEEISSVEAKPFLEHKKIQETPLSPSFSQSIRKPARTEALSNEALEEKLEEILK
jgi:ribosomal protein S6